MCATCGCGKPKDKHGMKTLSAANKKFAKKKASNGKLSPKQKKIAGKAGDPSKIDAADLAALRAKKKKKK